MRLRQVARKIEDQVFDPAMRAATLALLAFLYAPIAVLIVYSFSQNRVALILEGFSLDAYRRLLWREEFYQALANSFLLGLATAIIATAAGSLLAWFLERHSGRLTSPVSILAHMPLFFPELMMAIGLLFFSARVVRPLLEVCGISWGSFPSVLAGHVAFSIPYVQVLVRARLRKFDTSLEEAARDLGASPGVVFRRIILPWIEPAIVAGAFLSFALSLDDFYVSYFVSVGGSGFATLPVYLYALQSRQGVTTELNALAALIMVASLGLVILSAAVQLRGGIDLTKWNEESP